MALTEQQERFAQLVAVDRKSQRAAYLEAYGDGGAASSTIDRRARAVATQPEVVARVKVLVDGATEKLCEIGAYTLQAALIEAEEARQLAHERGQASAAAAAVKLKAQIAGHVLDKKEVSTKDPLTGATIEELGRMRDEITRRMLAAKAAEPPDSRPIALPVGRAA